MCLVINFSGSIYVYSIPTNNLFIKTIVEVKQFPNLITKYNIY